MKVAYFVNQYPKVSHSFIRREIQAHEEAGVEIVRYALRCDASELADEADKREMASSRYVLREPLFDIARTVLSQIAANPAGFVRAAVLALRIGWRSDRGLLRHIAYLAEACVLSQWCRGDGIDHLHAHFGTNPAAIAMLAKEMTGTSYSFTVHGPEEFDKPQFIGLPEKIRRCAFVVGVSSFGRSQLYRWAALPDWDKVRVVHCGIDPAFHEGGVDAAPDVPRLVCVARLAEQKGLMLLVEAARRLALREVPFEIVLVGDGPLRSEIEDLIRKNNLSARISITGWVDSARVREEIVKSRAMVLPSFAEGLPVVIMEAMALSRPVIATYIAGIPELVGPGSTGWLVPAGDSEALERAMREALEMPIDEVRSMGKKARAIVLERHDINTEAGKLREAILALPTSQSHA